MIVAGFGFQVMQPLTASEVLLKIQDLNTNFLNLW